MNLVPLPGAEGIFVLVNREGNPRSFLLAHRQGLGRELPIANERDAGKLDLRLSLLLEALTDTDPGARAWAHLTATAHEWRYELRASFSKDCLPVFKTTR